MAKKELKHTEAAQTPIERLKVLVIIVPRGEGEVYQNYLETIEVALQLRFHGYGTASKAIINLLELDEGNRKDIVFTVIKESRVTAVLDYIQTRFELTPKKKGIAFVIPVSSIIGKFTYNYLINNNKIPQGGK